VDKYAPRGFTQLLSPEKINREVLKALKKWDRFVFKTDNHTGELAGWQQYSTVCMFLVTYGTLCATQFCRVVGELHACIF
jgi:hypothetical protein